MNLFQQTLVWVLAAFISLYAHLYLGCRGLASGEGLVCKHFWDQSIFRVCPEYYSLTFMISPEYESLVFCLHDHKTEVIRLPIPIKYSNNMWKAHYEFCSDYLSVLESGELRDQGFCSHLPRKSSANKKDTSDQCPLPLTRHMTEEGAVCLHIGPKPEYIYARAQSSYNASPVMEHALRKASEDPITLDVFNNITDLGILYLYSHNAHYSSQVARIDSINYLRDPTLCNVTDDKCKTAANRLHQMIRPLGDPHNDTLPNEMEMFIRTDWREYADDNIFFVNYSDTLLQRKQLSGVCFAHGPSMVQYYAICKSIRDLDPSASINHTVLNIGKYLRNTRSGDRLRGRIFEDAGEGSIDFLEEILDRPKKKTLEKYEYDQIPAYFRENGVGLISRFRMYREFYDVSKKRHHMRPTEGVTENAHSMALVGFRFEKGKRFYLLQNWWLKKQFVEVSEDYLIACEAKVTFVMKPQYRMKPNTPSVSGVYAEGAGYGNDQAYNPEG